MPSRQSSVKPLKVALIANSFTPGGAELYLYRLYSGLVAKGLVDVTLIGTLPDWPRTLGRPVPAGIAPKLTRKVPIIPQLKGLLSNAMSVRRVLGDRPFDMVHVQYSREKLVLPGYFSRNLPVFWTEHGPLASNFPRWGMPLLRLQARRSTVTAVSDAVRDSLVENGISSRVIWNPLPDSSMNQSDRIAGSYSDYVLYAGRVHESKRIDLLLAAASKTPSTRIKIAGTGPDLARLQKIAPNNVEFLGHLSNLESVMRDSLAVVTTSGQAAREGSPLVVLEARNLGVPVLVASDSHAAEEGISLGAHTYDPQPADLAQKIAALGDRVKTEPLAPLQRSIRGEERWLMETYDLMQRTASREMPRRV